jgi:hypothetical protein
MFCNTLQLFADHSYSFLFEIVRLSGYACSGSIEFPWTIKDLFIVLYLLLCV